MSTGLAVVLIIGAFLVGAVFGFVCTAVIMMSDNDNDDYRKG